jgi:PAS domain S-box-containing protein
LAFLPVAPLVWIAVRFGPRLAAMAFVFTSSIVLWHTIHGAGPFALATENESLLLLLVFFWVIGIPGAVLVNDVSARKAAETALLESKRMAQNAEKLAQERLAELEAFYNTAPIGLCVFDKELRYERINERMAELNGVPAAAHIGRTVREIIPDLADKAEPFLRRVIESGEPVIGLEFTIEPKAKPGALRTWRGSWHPLKNASGQVTRVNVVAQEITERKRAEEQIRESEELFRLLIQEIQDYGIFTMDADGRVMSWNLGAERLHGFKAEDIIGRYFAFCHTPEEIEKGISETELRAAAERGRFETEGYKVRRDGSRYWASMVLTAIHDQGGGLRGFSKVIHDITERKNNEIALLEAKRVAEKASRAKDDFIAALSHELRTPLTPVLMTATSMEHDETLTPDLRQQMGLIRHDVELEARLIDDLLDLTKIARGKFSLHLENVDLRELLLRTVEMLREDFVPKQLEIRLDDSARFTIAHCDPARLQQVLWNLIKNAIKFTPEKGIIHVRTFNANDQTLSVEIRDTGIGIAPELLEKIFTPFEQGSLAGDHRFGGLGLGLAIANAIVEVHHGTIAAASAGLNQGASFTFTPQSRSLGGCAGSQGALTQP